VPATGSSPPPRNSWPCADRRRPCAQDWKTLHRRLHAPLQGEASWRGDATKLDWCKTESSGQMLRPPGAHSRCVGDQWGGHDGDLAAVKKMRPTHRQHAERSLEGRGFARAVRPMRW